jgi:hypothetical protein
VSNHCVRTIKFQFLKLMDFAFVSIGNRTHFWLNEIFFLRMDKLIDGFLLFYAKFEAKIILFFPV